MSTPDIFVVVPRGYGLILHLHSPGYQPSGDQSARKRSNLYPRAMCNAWLNVEQLVPLRDGLTLRRTHDGTGPAWRWCRVCIGHAVALAGLDQQVLTRIATERQEEVLRGAPQAS